MAAADPRLVAYADGPDSARISPADALAAAGLTGACEVLLGLTTERHPWLDDPALRGRTMLPGYALSGAVADGRLTPIPARLTAVPSLLAERPPDLGVIAVVRRGDGYAFAGSVGWGPELAATAERLVLEVADGGRDLGGPAVTGNVVAVVEREGDPAPVPQRDADEIDRTIGALVASLVPEGATVQFGPGGIGEGIASSLHRPLHVHSGLLTDAMASLHERGLLLTPAVAAYTWGGEPIQRLAGAGMLRLAPVSATNDSSAVAAIPRFVACNTAIQVGFDGAVNVERIGDRVITGVGGHSDFCAGASRSIGGLSIIALRSTAVDGSPTIVERVDVVSTPRSDVDIVVTEHGIADLRGASDKQRASRLREVAG
jgi:acyl CoA:acetate/3-ketoacid CoA transferase beta subunit